MEKPIRHPDRFLRRHFTVGILKKRMEKQIKGLGLSSRIEFLIDYVCKYCLDINSMCVSTKLCGE